MSYRYSSRSLSRLNTAHPDLVLLFREALDAPDCPSDITILEGFRSEQRQNELYDPGKSQLKWPRSYHNKTHSRAVAAHPYVHGGTSWDWTYYHPLAAHLKATWKRLQAEGRVSSDLRLEWGGDWQSFPDVPPWQLAG